jgi:hypothetical protein
MHKYVHDCIQIVNFDATGCDSFVGVVAAGFWAEFDSEIFRPVRDQDSQSAAHTYVCKANTGGAIILSRL